MKIPLFSIACSLASFTLPASAVVVNVGGFDFDITASNTSYNDSAALLEAQPWFGNQQLAEQFAATVGGAAGTQLTGSVGDEPGKPWGPLFLFNDPSANLGTDNSSVYNVHDQQIYFGSFAAPFDTATYAQAVSLTTGGSQQNPILPTIPTRFSGPSGAWFDPIAASGFEFTTTDGSLFTDILNFPVGVDGDNNFEVWTGGSSLGTFNVGESVNFGVGVSNFTITGIDPTVDGEDPTVFPVQLAFNTPTASFTMVPIPEPSSAALLGLGGLALMLRRRR